MPEVQLPTNSFPQKTTSARSTTCLGYRDVKCEANTIFQAYAASLTDVQPVRYVIAKRFYAVTAINYIAQRLSK
jgi:hypothetical protein